MVRRLAAGLAKAGIESHVATTNDNADGTLEVALGDPVFEDGATYHYFQRQARFYTFSLPLAAWLRRHVSWFDVVHIHALFSWAALPASHWAYWKNVPYVVRPLGTLNEWGMTERRPWAKAASFRLIEKRIVDHAALMHYTSEQERLEAELLGVRTRAVVIPNALPPFHGPARGTFRSQYPQIDGRPIVLFLSRIDPKKGLDLLLHAFGTVKEQGVDAVLVVAGDAASPYASELQALGAALGLQQDVIWTGFLHGDAKNALLADSDVFVLPSHSENFGIAVAEAMAAGLPVVVSDQVAIAGDVARANAGRVVTRDPQAIAAAIVELLGSEAMRRTAGRGGRQLAADTYSEAAVTARIVDAYRQMVR